jgi:hypothetical protein
MSDTAKSYRSLVFASINVLPLQSYPARVQLAFDEARILTTDNRSLKNLRHFCAIPSLNRLLLSLMLLLVGLMPGQKAYAQGQTDTRNSLSLSAGTPPPLASNINVGLSNAGPGASASGVSAGQENFNSGADFGDLGSVTNGLPAQAVLGLRIRATQSYQVLCAEITWTATNLQYGGVDISGTVDRGSFIKMVVGTPQSAGPDTNVSGSNVNAALGGEGLGLNQVAYGSVAPGYATMIISGGPTLVEEQPGAPPMGSPVSGQPTTPNMMAVPSTGMVGVDAVATNPNSSTTATGITTPGLTNSPATNLVTSANGTKSKVGRGIIDLPMYFVLPTGFALGPAHGTAPGTFATQLQFGIFPRP